MENGHQYNDTIDTIWKGTKRMKNAELLKRLKREMTRKQFHQIKQKLRGT